MAEKSSSVEMIYHSVGWCKPSHLPHPPATASITNKRSSFVSQFHCLLKKYLFISISLAVEVELKQEIKSTAKKLSTDVELCED